MSREDELSSALRRLLPWAEGECFAHQKRPPVCPNCGPNPINAVSRYGSSENYMCQLCGWKSTPEDQNRDGEIPQKEIGPDWCPECDRLTMHERTSENVVECCECREPHTRRDQHSE